MGQFNLNLSTRPFKPHRAINLLMAILLVALVGVSGYQVYTYRKNSRLAGGIRRTQLELKQKSEQLTKDLQALNGKMYSGNVNAKMSQVELLNLVIAKRQFSWTRVFAALEQTMPENCYLIGIRPFLDPKGKIGLNITYRGKTFADGAEFLRLLESSPMFTETALGIEEKFGAQGEVDFAVSTYYVAPTSAKGAE